MRGCFDCAAWCHQGIVGFQQQISSSLGIEHWLWTPYQGLSSSMWRNISVLGISLHSKHGLDFHDSFSAGLERGTFGGADPENAESLENILILLWSPFHRKTTPSVEQTGNHSREKIVARHPWTFDIFPWNPLSSEKRFVVLALWKWDERFFLLHCVISLSSGQDKNALCKRITFGFK